MIVFEKVADFNIVQVDQLTDDDLACPVCGCKDFLVWLCNYDFDHDVSECIDCGAAETLWAWRRWLEESRR